jgi:nicotinate-nucleotide adenylyltransferase
MRIGLFGGSFNPVHNAHIRIAAEAQRACQLDSVVFIPAAEPPHKPLAGDISFVHRLTMVRLAIAGRNDFQVSAVEAEREGKSYSIETIVLFRERFPDDELFFIVGGDSFREIGTWHRYAEIFAFCNLIVVERPGHPVIDPLEILTDAIRGDFSYTSSTGCLTHVASGFSTFFITGTPQELSSTEIRRLAAADSDISRYVPADVATYISQQRIYYQWP